MILQVKSCCTLTRMDSILKALLTARLMVHSGYPMSIVPSFIHVKRDGTIMSRYVPIGDKEKLADAQIPVVEAIPAIYSKRIANRGFEGVTISPDGKFLYASIQSPMAVPDKATGEASRNLRILKMDLTTNQVVGEYVYVAEMSFKTFVNVTQKDVVISDLQALCPLTFCLLMNVIKMKAQRRKSNAYTKSTSPKRLIF